MSFGISLVLSVADKLPAFEITGSCKEVFGFGLTLPHNRETCIADEKEAHDRLHQKWSSYPATERGRCVGETMIGTPSYVDILTCLEMTQEGHALNKSLMGASKTKRGLK